MTTRYLKSDVDIDGNLTVSGSINGDIIFDNIAAMVASTELTIGMIAITRGYYAVGDTGGHVYTIVAAATGTADGGSYINLSGIAGQAEGIFNKLVEAEKFGVRASTESSTEWQAAWDYCASLAGSGRSDLDNAIFSCKTLVLTNTSLVFDDGAGGPANHIDIYHQGKIKAVAGGDLSAHTDADPVNLIVFRVAQSTSHWGIVDCDFICAGVIFRNAHAHRANRMDLLHFIRHGVYVKSQSNGALTLINFNVKQYISSDAGWNTDSNYTADCLVSAHKDWVIQGGTWGWARTAMLFLDKTPSANAGAYIKNTVYLEKDRLSFGTDVYGDTIIYRVAANYTSANLATDTLSLADDIANGRIYQATIEGGNTYRGQQSEGSGDVFIYAAHLMQTRPGGPPRKDNITEGGPILLDCYNNTNLLSMLGCDFDAGILAIYGDSINISESSYISGGTNKTDDSVYVVDPRMRVYADRGNNPGKLSITAVKGMSIAYFDNPNTGETWNGVYTTFNVTARQESGAYVGEVQYTGELDGSASLLPSGGPYNEGDYFIITGDGTIGTTNTLLVEEGNLLFALINTPSSTDGLDWYVSEYSDVNQRNAGREPEANSGTVLVQPRTNSQPLRNIFKPGGEIHEVFDLAGATGGWSFNGTDYAFTSGISGNYTGFKWNDSWGISATGNFRPEIDNISNLGTSTKRPAETYLLDVFIDGDLTIGGTTTTINSTTVTIDDPVFTLGGDIAPVADDNKDRGIEFRYYDSAARIGFFGFDDSTNRFTALGLATNTSEVFSGTLLDAEFGTIYGALSGNATTADAWATARTITLTGDVTGVSASWDGSNNISFATTITANSVALGTDTTGNYIATGATSGSGISGSVTGEGTTFTVTSNATTASTASTIALRDSSGNMRSNHLSLEHGNASVLFDGSVADGFSDNSVGPKKRITSNDGSGDFNIWAGGYNNAGEKFVDTGSGASKIEFSSDAIAGEITLQVAATGTADAPITWDTTVTINTSGLSIVGDISATGLYLGGATAADYITGIATTTTYFNKTADSVLTSDIVFDAAAEVTITYGATITADMDTFMNGVVTMTGDGILDFTNITAGQSGAIRFIQDGTGSRLLTYTAECEFAGGVPITLTTSIAAEDVIYYRALTATRVLLSAVLDIS